MSFMQAVLLGLLQGLTEFLPVSSSGHLLLAQHFFKLQDVPLLFDIFLHLATLCSVVVFFRKQIAELIMVLFRWVVRRPIEDTAKEKAGRQMIAALILGTLVTGIMGLAASKIIPSLPIQFVPAGFLVSAVILVLSSRFAAKPKANMQSLLPNETAKTAVTPVQGLITGFAQGIGVLPGISRSGASIAGGLFCGIDRNTAGEFSFILSIPAILGAFLLELKDMDELASSLGALPIIAGCIAAFVSGLFAVALLIKLIRKGRLEYFALYLVPLAIAGFIFL